MLKCSVESCNKMRMKNGVRELKFGNKVQLFSKYCYFHREISKGRRFANGKLTDKEKIYRKELKGKNKERLDIDISVCSVCGWDKATCDIHRILSGKNGGKYVTNNVIVLCPNCHRLVHRGIITL